MKKTWRSALSMLLVFCLLFGVCSNGLAILAAEAGVEEGKPIKYVSLGDSMTNGYGFIGYNQDKHTAEPDMHVDPSVFNFFDGTGVYGEGSYANQFAEYLADKGYDVTHTKLATSAFRAEDLVVLLGLVENPLDATVLPLKDGYFNNSWAYVWNWCDEMNNTTHGWEGYGIGNSCGLRGYHSWFLDEVVNEEDNYSFRYAEGEAYWRQFLSLSNHYQTSLKEADVISLAFGNASFDAYVMDRLFKIWGALGDSFSNYQHLITLDEIKDQLCETEAEKAVVDKAYATMVNMAADFISEENCEALKVDQVCQLMTYVFFSFMYRYKQIIAWIGENNPDAEIMIVGQLNSYYGLSMAGIGDKVVDMGEAMGALCDVMNTYVAGMCADYEAKHPEFTGKLLFVEQPEKPEMIATVIDELAASGWGTIDNGRLDGAIVRYKTIEAYNDYLYPGFKAAGLAGSAQTYPLNDCNAGITEAVEQALAQKPDMTLQEMMDAMSWKRNWICGSLAYLGCEAVMLESLNETTLELDAIVEFSNNETMVGMLSGAPQPMDTSAKMADIINDFSKFYRENMMGVIRFFAFNKMGSGIAAHPTPSNHDRLAKNVIAAHENGYTCADKYNENPAFVVANKIYAELTPKGLLTIDQTLAIMDYAANALTSELDTDAAMDYIYELLIEQQVDDAARLEVIGTVYPIIKAAGYLDGMPVNVVEGLYDVLYPHMNNEQTFAIFDYIYESITDNGKLDNDEIRHIAKFIYFDVLVTPASMRRSAPESGLTPAEKLAILGDIYGVLKEAGYVDSTPKLAALENLYIELTEGADPLVSAEKALEIMDKIVETYIEEDEINSTVIENVTTEIVEDLLNDPAIPVAKKTAIAQKVGIAMNGMMTEDQKEDLIDGLFDYMKQNGYFDKAQAEALAYATDLLEEMKDVLHNEMDPALMDLHGELLDLNKKYQELTAELDEKMADLIQKEEVVLKEMIAERDALIEELEALNAKLESLCNGTFLRTVPTTDALEAAIADTKAKIAETEAEIAELDAAIAWAYEQIVSDKSGIEAIKAAIEDVLENIKITEAALAEAIAAAKQLKADILKLDESLKVLAAAAEHLAGLGGIEVEINPETVMEAAIYVLKNLPAIIEQAKETYAKVLDVVEKVEKLANDIENSVNNIRDMIAELIDTAEELVGIQSEKANELKAALEQMHEEAQKLALAQIPVIGDAAVNAGLAIADIALREHAKVVKLYNENEELVWAAAGIGYWYCVQKGYIDQAKQLIVDYTDITHDELNALENDLTYAETMLTNRLIRLQNLLEEKRPVIEAELKRLHAELVAYDESIDPVIEAQIKEAIRIAEAELAKIEAQIKEAKELIKQLKDFVAEVRAAIANVRNALNDVKGAIELVDKDVKSLIAALKNLKAAVCNLSESIVVLHDAVVDEVVRVLGYAEVAADEAIDVIENLISYVDLLKHIPALLEEAVTHATNDHFLVSQDSHYVALGDANAYDAAADLLAEHLSAYLGAKIGYNNATVAGQTAADLLAMLPELKETLAKADLVTIGFSANTFTQFVVDQVSAAMMGSEVAELDWEGYLGAEGAAYVAEAMAELKAELEANGAGEMMGMNLADAVALAIESYAYAYMEFVIHYVQVVDGVHAINPEAQVVLVGMHNPMAGVVLDMEGTEIALGDYLEYLIKVSNLYAFGYAFVVPETIYVNAPTVETKNEAGTQGALFFLMDLLMFGTENYVPTEEGYAYIEEQIWNALNVYKKGLLGDVDSNGVVNHIDAMLVLQYYTEVIGAADLDLSVADVDGNGVINHVDSMLILQYYTEVIDVFPAA